MSIKDFPEKQIRNQIKTKLKPTINSKRSKHAKALIIIEGKKVARVKLPNEHSQIMHQSKSRYIASDLHLTDEEFNQLIDCTLKGKEYCKIIKDKV